MVINFGTSYCAYIDRRRRNKVQNVSQMVANWSHQFGLIFKCVFKCDSSVSSILFHLNVLRERNGVLWFWRRHSGIWSGKIRAHRSLIFIGENIWSLAQCPHFNKCIRSCLAILKKKIITIKIGLDYLYLKMFLSKFCKLYLGQKKLSEDGIKLNLWNNNLKYMKHEKCLLLYRPLFQTSSRPPMSVTSTILNPPFGWTSLVHSSLAKKWRP